MTSQARTRICENIFPLAFISEKRRIGRYLTNDVKISASSPNIRLLIDALGDEAGCHIKNVNILNHFVVFLLLRYLVQVTVI